MMNIVPAPTN